MIDLNVIESLSGNETVKVKLTDRGAEILKHYREKWHPIFQRRDPPSKLTTQPDEDGWLEFNIYDLLAIFEGHTDEDGPELFTEFKYVDAIDH